MRSKTTSALVAALAFAATFCAIFAPSFSANARLAHRDEAFYYYPLFERAQARWEALEFPAWDPQDNLGQPFAGDPTASVFYPGKAIFFLASAGLASFGFCFKLYIWSHVALAFFWSRRLARRFGASGIGATISGLSYAFSGQVLFQYSNVIYLVGAAWAPALFLYALEVPRRRRLKEKARATLKFGIVGATTVLGGEPQIVCFALAATTCAMLFGAKSRRASRARALGDAALFSTGACAIVFALAAAQILPSLEFVARSNRAVSTRPRSIWEAPRVALEARRQGTDLATLLDDPRFFDEALCRDMTTQGRNATTYRFSVGPHRWLEFFFPNVGGRQFPQAARWFDAFPGELSVWTPTLYFGILPCLLALATLRFRSAGTDERKTRRVFWSALILFGLLGALGGYGLGWAFRALRAFASGESIGREFGDGDPVGGLYWLLVVFAPKFAEFRFPAKLATLAALGFSVLAGQGWDARRDSKRFRALVRWTLVASFVGLASALVARAVFGGDFLSSLNLAPNPLYGPFQPRLAARAVDAAFGQTAAVLCAFILIDVATQRALVTPRAASILASALVALDLAVANAWTIETAPTQTFEHESTIARSFLEKRDRILRELQASNARTDATIDPTSIPPIRIYRCPVWFPPVFQRETSTKRTLERVYWDVETLFPKYSFARGLAALDSRGAAMDRELTAYLDAVPQRGNVAEELAVLAVDGVVGPKLWTERVAPANEPASRDWKLDVRIFDATSRRARVVPKDATTAQNPGDAQIVEYRPEKLVCVVRADVDATILFAEQAWPGWRATVAELDARDAAALVDARFRPTAARPLIEANRAKEKEASIKTARFLRAVDVKKGYWQIVMEYRPRRIWAGAAISCVGWLATLACARATRTRKNARRGAR